MLKKNLLIKLGSLCNLKCPHCHSHSSEFEYNPDIVKFAIDGNFDEIAFSGGEPLLYIDNIKRIVGEINNPNIAYRFVTNGTLLTDELVGYFNNNNFYVCFSYDGSLGHRDGNPDYSWASKLNGSGLSVTVYKDNMNLFVLDSDVIELSKNHGTRPSYVPSFAHQTKDAPNIGLVDDDDVVSYTNWVGKKLELEMYAFTVTRKMEGLTLLFNLSHYWFCDKPYRGVCCCNEMKYNLTLSGDFLLCPYGTTVVGNIHDGVDWDKVESYKPERCKNCKLWNICQNRCIANITDRECKIFKILHNHYLKLLDKYHLTSEDFL